MKLQTQITVNSFDREIATLRRPEVVAESKTFWRYEEPVLNEKTRQLEVGGFWPFQKKWWDLDTFVKLLVAGYGCLAGETILQDAVTGEKQTAQERSLTAKPFRVWSLMPDGTKKIHWASAPFKKGKTALFRITMEDGRSVVVTKQHRFFTRQGWQSLDSLRVSHQLRCERDLRASTLGNDQLIHALDEQHLKKINEGYFPDYQQDSHSCDGQPQSSASTGPALLPSQAGAPGRSRWSLRADVLAGESEYTRAYLHAARHATSGCGNPAAPRESNEKCLIRQGASEQALRCSQDVSQFEHTSISSLQASSREKDQFQSSWGHLLADRESYEECRVLSESRKHGAAKYETSSSAQELLQASGTSCKEEELLHEKDYNVLASTDSNSWIRISKIEFVREDDFYDLTVPGPANYLAQGIWHHNSGKTICLCKRIISSALANAPCMIACVSPTLRMAKRTVIRTMLELLEGRRRIYGTAFWYRHNKTTNEILIRFRGRFATILILSAENPEHLKGPNLAAAYMDEPFIMHEDVFTQMVARVRHPEAELLEIGMAGTPETINWGYKLCKRKPIEGLEGLQDDLTVGVVHASTTENKVLDPKYVKRLMTRLSPRAVEAYINGQFVNLTEGRVYYAFDDGVHVEEREMPKYATLGCGMDFNVDPMAAVVFWEHNGHVHIIEEIELENSDTEQMAQEINSRYPKLIDVYPDPAGNQRKTSSPGGKTDFYYLRENGFTIHSPAGHYNMKDTWNILNGRFRPGSGISPKLTISKDCPKLIEYLNAYSHRLAPKQENMKHLLDALRYPIAHMFPLPTERVGRISVSGI